MTKRGVRFAAALLVGAGAAASAPVAAAAPVPLAGTACDLFHFEKRHEFRRDRVRRHLEGHAQDAVEAGRSLDAADRATAAALAVIGMQHMAEIWRPEFEVAMLVAIGNPEPDRMAERQRGERDERRVGN